MRAVILALAVVAACSSPQSNPSPTPLVVRPDLSNDMVLPPTLGLREDTRIAAMLRDVDPQRIRSYDSTLVAFGTRNTYSDSLSNSRGTGAARRWIHAQFSRFSADCGGCLKVEFDTATAATPRNT